MGHDNWHNISMLVIGHVAIMMLTHWGRVTHIYVGNFIIIGSDNGFSPGRCQAIIWTNAGILLIGPLGTNFSEILIEIHIFSFKKMYLKWSSAKWRLGLDVLQWIAFAMFNAIRVSNLSLLKKRQIANTFCVNEPIIGKRVVFFQIFRHYSVTFLVSFI